jgi:BolA protein
MRWNGMRVIDVMRRKLEAAFAPSELDIEDQSALHAGHAGARPEGETHFRVRLVSTVFEGLSRVERQQRIHTVLAEELRTRIHALSLEARAPTEIRPR